MAQYLVQTAPRNPDGTLYHNQGEPWIWVDAFYMAPSFLAVAGYNSEAVWQVEGFRRALWNPQARLFHHIWDAERRAFSRDQHWSVGNGWAVSGMARVAWLGSDFSS